MSYTRNTSDWCRPTATVGIPEGRGQAVAERAMKLHSPKRMPAKVSNANLSAYGQRNKNRKLRRYVAAVRLAETEASRRDAPLPQWGFLRDVQGGCGQGRRRTGHHADQQSSSPVRKPPSNTPCFPITPWMYIFQTDTLRAEGGHLRPD